MGFKGINYLINKYSITHRSKKKRHTDWAYSVKYRDNFTCQDCGYHGKGNKDRFLQAHHIKPKSLFPKLKYDLKNGITLCHWCHKKRDKETLTHI